MKMKTELSRREKLYVHIISRAANFNQWHGNNPPVGLPTKDYLYFSWDINVGDLIMGASISYKNQDVYAIGICKEIISNNNCIVQDIFSGAECNWTNDTFTSIHGVSFEYLLTDTQHKFNLKVKRIADRVGEDECFLPVNIIFDGDKVTYTTREKWTPIVVDHNLKQSMKSLEIVDYFKGKLKELDK